MKQNDKSIPYRPIHPGEILREELNARGIKPSDFALQIGVQPDFLNAFIGGQVNMDGALASRLEKHLGIPSAHWLRFNDSYLSDCCK
jgi:HTH-type transcriptional regulator/antitoxin HigA